MSAALEAMISSGREMTFKPQMEEKEDQMIKDNMKKSINAVKCGDHQIQNAETDHEDHNSNDSDEETEEEGGDLTKLESEKNLHPGPLVSLKDQLEKDKDDESLRKWKEQLLGRVDLSTVGEIKEPEVKILSLTIQRQCRPDLVLPIPFTNNSKSSLFTLKQGNRYRLKFTFTVANNIVSGLKYTNCVWKSGLR
ncbi:rho GDP-dissociation inhibitor 1, partial [Morus notabilis]